MSVVMHSAKELLLKLISATNESETKKIIDMDPILNNENNWKPYGGYYGNFNTIHNQQQNSVASLIEKPINSIDHLLLKRCKQEGIDPESYKAPSTMQEATEKFFGIKKGDFSEIGQAKRKELAKNIYIIAEGSKEQPNIVIADSGEGQHPKCFEKTFVSLHHGNKDKIRFVQGKYNMGGTGVLAFCGNYHYELILSRKTPELLQKGESDDWGYTLVRLHIVTSSLPYKNSWYEYCTSNDGQILSFPGEALYILPENDVFISGTYIKLYDYDLPNPSVVTLDLWREMNKFLYSPALPFLIYENRDYKGHSQSKVMLGNKSRLLVDDNDKVDERLTINAEIGQFGKRNIEITLFKDNIIKSEFTSADNAIFFTINGQTHASLGRSFLKTKAKLSYIADYLLVHIDCTDVEVNIREQTFMPDRERMRRNEICRELEAVLANELEKHEGLRALNQLRREQQVFSNPKDVGFLEGVVSKLIKTDQSLINYLGFGGGVKDVKKPGKLIADKYEGKKFPTYLQIQSFGSKDKMYKKQIPTNSYARLYLETDVANDYFDRTLDNGDLKISPDICSSSHLWNGIITLKLIPLKNAKVGDVHPVLIELTRPYDESLFITFQIEYTAPTQPQTKPTDDNKKTKVMNYKLPNTTLVYKDNWEKHGWNGEDIAKVAEVALGDGSNGNGKDLDIFINMDADILRNHIFQNNFSAKQRDFAEKVWQTTIFINTLVLYNDLHEIENEELLPHIIKSTAKTILPLSQNELLFKDSSE